MENVTRLVIYRNEAVDSDVRIYGKSFMAINMINLNGSTTERTLQETSAVHVLILHTILIE